MNYRLGIIGGGNMGSAIVRGCTAAGVLSTDEVIMVEIDPDRRAALQAVGVHVSDQISDAAEAQQIMLAVKPQSFASVAGQLQSHCRQGMIVISIMAGLNSRLIRQSLHQNVRIIRAMPNLPCQIGEGMTAIALGAGAMHGDEALTISIFNAIGRTVMVDESLMYTVTAVSGSGPAYIFLLAEAMEAAATALQIDQPTARAMVEQTILGSAKLLSQSRQTASELRQAVTSPGGTTAAALDVFEKREFTQSVIAALTAARDRGRELDAK